MALANRDDPHEEPDKPAANVSSIHLRWQRFSVCRATPDRNPHNESQFVFPPFFAKGESYVSRFGIDQSSSIEVEGRVRWRSSTTRLWRWVHYVPVTRLRQTGQLSRSRSGQALESSRSRFQRTLPMSNCRTGGSEIHGHGGEELNHVSFRHDASRLPRHPFLRITRLTPCLP